MRQIDKVLLFRQDISPFLVHLTKKTIYAEKIKNPKDNLINILRNKSLDPGDCLLDAKNGHSDHRQLDKEKRLDLFNAICFTETPINEIHCLLDISNRMTDLTEYGIVFVKDKLKLKNVSPVLYINNWDGDNDDIFYELCKIEDKNVAKKLLPLIAVIGKKVKQQGYDTRLDGEVDFIWEREWRRPRIYGKLNFLEKDAFVGLCPHEEIDFFEGEFNWLKFIDPKRNMKWYADRLIESRKRCGLEYSVV